MGSEAGQSESDECVLTSVSTEVNPFWLKKSGYVAQGTCSPDNVIMWSNRSGGASPSTTQTSVQAGSNRSHFSSFKPCASALRPASMLPNAHPPDAGVDGFELTPGRQDVDFTRWLDECRKLRTETENAQATGPERSAEIQVV